MPKVPTALSGNVSNWDCMISDKCYGDEIDGEIRWEAGADLGNLAGQPVRLRFVLKDADVYAFQFGCRDTE